MCVVLYCVFVYDLFVTCVLYGVCCAALLCDVCFVMLYSILRLYIILCFVNCAL